MVCGVDHWDCMLHSCEECPGKDDLRTYLTNLLEQFDIEEISFNQWQKNDRQSCLVQLEMSNEQYLDTICNQFDKVSSFLFAFVKEHLTPNNALILLDFAENYNFLLYKMLSKVIIGITVRLHSIHLWFILWKLIVKL